jgi:GNAT superfamily N-acetyltransferase
MIELVPLEPEAFPVFAERVVLAYAAAKTTAREWNAIKAIDLARAEVSERLRFGVSTPEHAIFCIQTLGDKRRVGELWIEFRIEADLPVCAVLDLYIDPLERKQGYGRAALLAVEEIARRAGSKAMRLSVIGDNMPARRLYASVGYHLLNARLGKQLDVNIE